MTPLTDRDWNALEGIASKIDFPSERITLARRRFGTETSRHGSPFTLVVGRPDAGIEKVIAQQFTADAAEELIRSASRPLILGQDAASVRPLRGSWANLKSKTVARGHVLALRIPRRPDAGLLAEIGSLGFIDQLVLVTRLGGPMHEHEREIARAFSSIAATVRVVVVGFPGEEPTENELAEVKAYVVVQLRQAGFDATRCRSSDVWFTGGPARPNTLKDLSAVFAIDEDAVPSGRNEMEHAAAQKIVTELKTHAATKPPKPVLEIADDERTRLFREFSSYLADIQRDIDRKVLPTTGMNLERLKAFVVDAFRCWGAYSGPEGFWLKYVERLRPGVQSALFEEVGLAAECLDYEPGTTAAPTANSARGPLWLEKIITDAKRAAVGLAIGVAAYVAATALLSKTPSDPAAQPSFLSSTMVTLIGYAAFFVSSVLGYGISRRFIRQPQPERAKDINSQPATIRGWGLFAKRLEAWLNDQLSAKQTTAGDDIQQIMNRLGIKETPE